MTDSPASTTKRRRRLHEAIASRARLWTYFETPLESPGAGDPCDAERVQRLPARGAVWAGRVVVFLAVWKQLEHGRC